MPINEEQKTLLEYNALDSAITMQCKQAFFNEIYDGYEDTYQHTIDLLNPLMFMMIRGIDVDMQKLGEAKVETENTITIKQEQLNNMVGRPINFNSPKQVSAYFYIEKGIKPYTNKDGKPTTDDKALTRLARGTKNRKPLPAAKLIQELRGLAKLKGTYLEIEFDKDGRFRSSCNPRGTKFGRISTGKTIYNTGMNMQNLPAAFKKFLVPDPGYLMFELDKRQAEWVVVAYASGDPNMISVLESGEDPHTHTAHLMFGVDKELIVKENKVVGHSTDAVDIHELRKSGCPEVFEAPFVPRIFSFRQAGKKSNHALNYDETYKMFALANEMTEAESKVICNKYHYIYPGIKQWHSHIQTQLGDNRTLINCFGRKCRFLERWGNDLFKAAYSYIPQSTVGELVNKALIDIYNDVDDRMLNVEIMAQVHDSILFQIPLTVPTDDILYCINKCDEYLTPQLEYNAREFIIHTDIKMGTENWYGLEEHDLENKQQLREVINGYKKIR